MVPALPAVLSLALILSPASAQVEWAFRNPLPTSENLEFVTGGGGQALALGSSGGILTSPDGLSWTRRHSGVPTRLWGAAWTGSRWVVVGDSGRVLTSVDGAAWSVAAGPGRILAVVWDGSQVIGVGQTDSLAAGIWTSPDGSAWTFRNTDVTYGEFRAVTWTGKLAVALGYGVFTSPDGVTWTRRATEGGWAVAGNADGMVAVGAAAALHSRDGIEWTRVPVPDDLGYARSLIWTGGQYLAIGGEKLWKSGDGETWEAYVGCEGCRSMAWTGQLLIGAGGSGVLQTSADGRAWSSPITGPRTNFNSAAWFGGRFLAAGDGPIATSTDGIAWSGDPGLPIGGVQPDRIQSLGSHGDRLLATGTGEEAGQPAAFLFESRDGAAWTARKTPVSFHPVCWTGTHYLAAGGYTLFRSADGLAWDSVAADSSRRFAQILWTGSQAVAMSVLLAAGGHRPSVSTRFWTSPDGVRWTARYTDSTRFWTSLAWTGRLLIAGGPELATSPDGGTWTVRKAGVDVWGVHWTGNRAVAVGRGGITWSSPDGLEWTRHEIPGSSPWLHAVAASGSPGRPGVLVAVGSGGTILSAPEEPGAIAVTPRSAPGSPLLRRAPGRLTISLPGHPLLPGTRVSLLSLDGRRRLAAGREGNGFAFPLGGLSAGLYLVEVARPGSRLLSLKYIHAP